MELPKNNVFRPSSTGSQTLLKASQTKPRMSLCVKAVSKYRPRKGDLEGDFGTQLQHPEEIAKPLELLRNNS